MFSRANPAGQCKSRRRNNGQIAPRRRAPPLPLVDNVICSWEPPPIRWDNMELEGKSMRKVAKYLGIGMLVLGLSACDNSKDQETAGAPDGAAQAQAQAQAENKISLLDGKLAFTLPGNMSDQSGKVGTQANNMHVYADSTGRKAVIIILSDDTPQSLDTLAQRLENEQRARDPDLQVVTNKAITVNGKSLQQLDSIIASGGKQAYSAVALGKVDNHLLTIQVTVPADDQQKAQSAAESIIQTLTLE